MVDMGVYAIEAAGLDKVKIGVAIDPYARLSQLQVGSPVELRLLAWDCKAMEQDETALHRRFAEYHVRGEWLAIAGQVKRWLDVFVATRKVKERDGVSERLGQAMERCVREPGSSAVRRRTTRASSLPFDPQRPA